MYLNLMEHLTYIKRTRIIKFALHIPLIYDFIKKYLYTEVQSIGSYLYNNSTFSLSYTPNAEDISTS